MISDSIGEGIATVGQGFVQPAVAALSTMSGLAIEYSNLAWAGATYTEINSMTRGLSRASNCRAATGFRSIS